MKGDGGGDSRDGWSYYDEDMYGDEDLDGMGGDSGLDSTNSISLDFIFNKQSAGGQIDDGPSLARDIVHIRPSQQPPSVSVWNPGRAFFS